MDHCYFCNKKIYDGDRIAGEVGFQYRVYPVCLKCGGEQGIGSSTQQATLQISPDDE